MWWLGGDCGGSQRVTGSSESRVWGCGGSSTWPAKGCLYEIKLVMLYCFCVLLVPTKVSCTGVTLQCYWLRFFFLFCLVTCAVLWPAHVFWCLHSTAMSVHALSLPPGYTGANCSDSICADVDCGNGSARVENDNVCRCSCSEGFTGPACQYPTCSGLRVLDHECYSNAPCTDDDHNGFQCDCPAGSTGEFCETIIQHCLPGVCNETGTRECQNLPNRPLCKCHAGFTGGNCSETQSPCRNSPCKNGGVCEGGSGRDEFHCRCPSPYTGDRCQSKMATCDNVTCLNQGTCEVEGGEAVCNCIKGFSREDCAMPPSVPTSE